MSSVAPPTNVLRRKLPAITKYDNTPMMTEAGKSIDEWNDSMILDKEALPLSVPTNTDLAQIVKEVVEGLACSVSEGIAYKILLLTWNMRSETDASKRIFPPKTPIPGQGHISELSSLLSVPAGDKIDVKIPNGEPELNEFIRQGCFVAASLLKLFTKEHKSWISAFEHIGLNYKKFTDVDFVFSDLVVNESSIMALRRHFQTKVLFKKTLGFLLYSLHQIVEGRGMTQMLFEQHLSYTGMHIINLFCKASFGLRAHPKDLLCALHTTAFGPTLDQLNKILCEYMSSKTPGKERETYKYARLYDSNMFSLLQTRHCADLVCILGHIGLDCGNTGSSNVLDITAVHNMSETAKEVYKTVAKNIFTYFKSDLPASENEMYMP